MSIDVGDITANPFNDRDLGDLTGLADSIKTDGLVQDITVMHTEEFTKHYPDYADKITTKYTLAFGERRWRATQLAGLSEIPAVLRNDLAPKIRRILFAENFHRKQLSPMEEARTFHRMHHDEGMSYRDIAAELSLSAASYVSRRMELMSLPQELQVLVGAEDGIGVTIARKLGTELTSPDDQILAWELIRDEDLSAKEAVRRVRSGEAVPQGNGVPVPRNSEESESLNDSGSLADGQQHEGRPEGGDPAPDEGAGQTATEKSPAQSPAPKPSPVKKTAQSSPVDRETAQRNHASADRDASCLDMITKGVELTPEQSDALFARALLAPTQQAAARSRAQKWLREAGKAGFTITDTESYFEAVLSSGNPDLIKTVTFATALAAGEVRARDGRRQWDRHDAEHVRLLIETVGHHPEAEWERRQLTKYGIAFPVGDATDADAID
ncbi:ParB/RepB/Spo0J family partition protein [Streptomyces lavendulocolor]|uniref:ParB/RepB/Spo0J family partition protein n=1 Tax=Streptomyces lavendulocolor TaxID=67316 RepID=UPI003C2F213F